MITTILRSEFSIWIQRKTNTKTKTNHTSITADALAAIIIHKNSSKIHQSVINKVVGDTCTQRRTYSKKELLNRCRPSLYEEKFELFADGIANRTNKSITNFITKLAVCVKVDVYRAPVFIWVLVWFLIEQSTFKFMFYI